jgi:cell wall-associated NlpC family hydrolase
MLMIGLVCLLSPAPAMAAARGLAPAPAPRSTAQRLTVGGAAARFSLRFLGTPYSWAGTTPSGFDCSGFTRFVYAHFGISLPHSSYAQWMLGRHVTRGQLRPGDLVFFGLGHVGLWLGHGRFVHAPQTGDVVSVERLRGGWYAGSYSGAVRLAGSQAPLLAPTPPLPHAAAALQR